LAQNKLRSFPFKLYLPFNKNFLTSYPKYEGLSLNVSSNLLDSLDEPSVNWLKHTAAVTDLSGNPWKCDCPALGVAWLELRESLTLVCASPEDRRGRTWDVLKLDTCRNTVRSVVITDSDKRKVPIIPMPNTSTDSGHVIRIPLMFINIIVLLGLGAVVLAVVSLCTCLRCLCTCLCACLRKYLCGKCNKDNLKDDSELPDRY
jgi:hypothetical protein